MPTIDMDRVADLVKKLLPGVPVELFNSGGNCATLAVGQQYVGKDLGADMHYPVLAGVGVFGSPSEAHIADFSVGYDMDMPDEPSCFPRPMPTSRERRAAEAIVRLYHAHPFVAMERFFAAPPADDLSERRRARGTQ